MGCEVAGAESRLARLERREIARCTVHTGCKRSRSARLHALRKQRSDDAAEHVAHAPAGHARIAIGTQGNAIPGATRYERPSALEHGDRARARGQRRYRIEAVDAHRLGGSSEQPRRLSRMRRDHRPFGQPPITRSEQIESICIRDHRPISCEHGVKHLFAPRRPPEAGTNYDHRCDLGKREGFCAGINGMRHRFGHAGEQRRQVRASRCDADKSRACSHRGFCGQDRSAPESMIPTDDQGVAKRALVRGPRSPRQAARDFAEAQQLRRRICLTLFEHLIRHAEISEGEIPCVIRPRTGEQAALRGNERDGGVCTHGDTAHATCVSIEAAGQIERKHRPTAVRDGTDRVREGRSNGTGNAGPEKRIHNDVSAQRCSGVEGLDLRTALQGPISGTRCIALQIGSITHLEELHLQPPVKRHASHDIAITGIVTTPTADREHLRIRPAIAQKLEGGCARAAHEHDARQAVALDRSAIKCARRRRRVQGIGARKGVAQHQRVGLIILHCSGLPFRRTLNYAILTPDPSAMDLHALADEIRTWGQELGFDAIGITDTELGEHPAHLERWLAAGHAASMDWMARHAELRAAPERLEPWTLRVISARMDYRPPEDDPLATLQDGTRAYVSRYALGRDYHRVIRPRLARLAERIEARVGGRYRAFTDSAPVLEKALAEKAGLGWIGKNTLLLAREAGSFFFLGEIFTDVPLPLDTPQERDHCGSCSACMTACPTDAFVGPRQLDAKRCIAYLTIEHRGPIPEALRAPMGNRVFGCDDCQLVCPWNKFSPATREDDFHPRHGLEGSELCALFAWDEATFLERTQGSAIRRTGYEGWLRNLAVGLGNAPPDPATLALLEARRADVNEMVREHIDWAIKRQRAGLAANAGSEH